jgi:tRNA threonylcarbamoyl adenosine modification protein (Sua5/YciO/YrdC/YwlC family)
MPARTRTVDVRGEGMGPEVLTEAVDHLRAGGLLLYPTETVYGLGSLMRGAGFDALIDLKKRGAGRPLLLLVDRPDRLPGLVWSPEAKTLAKQFWPGPLTLVLDDPGGVYPEGVRSDTGGVAVRVSPHPVCLALTQRLGEGLTSTSANLPGQPAAQGSSDLERLGDAIGGEVAGPGLLILDAGTLPPSDPSTVLDCRSSPPGLLRAGAVARTRLEEALGLHLLPSHRGGVQERADTPLPITEAGADRALRLLFVCSGNTCRSPLAEELSKVMLEELGLEGRVSVGSAGTGAFQGSPASRGSMRAAARHGLDLEGHQARVLTPSLVSEADLILTMSPHHLAAVEAMGGGARASLLSAYAAGSENPWLGDPVPDPFGGDDEIYEATYLELERLIRGALHRLQASLTT